MARYMEVTGCTRESFARLIAQTRENTTRNPNAYFYGNPLSAEEYLDARVVADPCTIFDCDILIDGVAAAVVTTTERARDLRNSPALISACASSRVPLALEGTNPTMVIEDMIDGSADIAKQLWEGSGVGSQEIDAAMLYDGFSVFVYTYLEGMGFAPRGEGFRFIDDGRGALGGELPVNTSGTSLGQGRLHGMGQIVEAALQVMGKSG